MDAAHDKTDKILSVLEQRIKDTYTRLQAEISESWRRYMDEVDVRVKKLHKAVSDAEDDEQRAKALAEYKRVVRNATLTNERYAAMVQETSERLSHVNEIALVCVNGELPKIYTLNYNETNNGIANAVNGYSFTLLDENTVRNLIESDETLLPLRHLDLAADMRWNTKKINAEVLQGILQGESVADIAARLERVTDMNRVSALRNARTAVTGAENKGRMDGYTQAKMLGVKLKKRWMSALDGRTRHTHRALNGQMRENDKPFEVDGYEIMYPGDPMAAPEMVYNCRCTTVAEVMGADELKTGEVKPVWAESMTDEEYSEWKGKRELNNEPESDKIEATLKRTANKLSASDFGSTFISKKSEEINTQKLVDFINSCEGADPDVIELYGKIGRLDNLSANGVKVSVEHGSKNAVSPSYNKSTGDLVECRINIPKLEGDDITGQAITTLHEDMHYIDLLCGDRGYSGGLYSTTNQSLIKAFNQAGSDITKETQSLFDAFHGEIKAVADKAMKAFDEEMARIETKFEERQKTDWVSAFKQYKAEMASAKKDRDKMIDRGIRNAMGGGLPNLEDIFDALSNGSYSDNNVVLCGHGANYYKNISARIAETVANYGSLSIARPDLIELLRKEKPDLVDALDATIKEMLKKAGV